MTQKMEIKTPKGYQKTNSNNYLASFIHLNYKSLITADKLTLPETNYKIKNMKDTYAWFNTIAQYSKNQLTYDPDTLIISLETYKSEHRIRGSATTNGEHIEWIHLNINDTEYHVQMTCPEKLDNFAKLECIEGLNTVTNSLHDKNF